MPLSKDNELGENIKKIRIEKKLTLEELAAKIDSSSGTLSHIENGTRKPSFDMLERISDALETPLSSLVSKGNPSESEYKELNPKLRPIIDSLDRAGDLQDEDIDEISKQVEFLINLKRKKR